MLNRLLEGTEICVLVISNDYSNWPIQNLD
jgi:hypothetical protein